MPSEHSDVISPCLFTEMQLNIDTNNLLIVLQTWLNISY